MQKAADKWVRIPSSDQRFTPLYIAYQYILSCTRRSSDSKWNQLNPQNISTVNNAWGGEIEMWCKRVKHSWRSNILNGKLRNYPLMRETTRKALTQTEASILVRASMRARPYLRAFILTHTPSVEQDGTCWRCTRLTGRTVTWRWLWGWCSAVRSDCNRNVRRFFLWLRPCLIHSFIVVHRGTSQ